MRVPFFRYSHVFAEQREAIQQALLTAAEAGALVLQEDLQHFEEALAAYCGVRHAVGVANATDGLELILHAAGIGAGHEVIMPAHTFVATAAAVVAVGACPVFAEVGADHLLDPADVAGRVTARTRAILPTQLNGRTADMPQLAAIAQRHGLTIIEDSAQGLGSRHRGRMAGTFGLAGVYSFYPAKLLGALGDGGAVVTDDPELARAIRQLRNHGRDEHTGEVVRWGRNSRLDNVQAAVLRVKLAAVDARIAHRRALAAKYHTNLADIDGLVLPPPPEEAARPTHFDVFQNYEVEAPERDALRTHLADRGVGTMLQWGGKAVHQFAALGIQQRLPRTETVMARALMLPMNTSLTDNDVDYVCEQVRSFFTAR